MTLNKDIYLTSASTEMDLVVISAGKFEQKLEEWLENGKKYPEIMKKLSYLIFL